MKENDYARLLKELITERKGRFDKFLMAQLLVAADLWEVANTLRAEMMGKPFESDEVGSTGQHKREVTPLLPNYMKICSILTQMFAALGLSYGVDNERVAEAGEVEQVGVAPQIQRRR